MKFGQLITRALAILTLVLAPQVATAEIQNLIIENVVVTTQRDPLTSDLANIWIRDGILKIVSKDEIAADGDPRIIDAGGGYLLGNLSVGARAKFTILDEDPIADINVLLDTAPHILFATGDGNILVNRLVVAAPEPPPPGDDEFQWHAYDPPPFALPNSISSDKWNTWKSKWVNGVFISALALDRQWISQDDASIAQFGDLSGERERGTIRGWRFGAAGTINFDRPWIYNIAGAWNSFDRGFDTTEESLDEFSFFDFSVDIPVGEYMIVRIGKQKEPINMDRSMTMIQLASQERFAAADAMFPSRNVGVTLYGTAASERLSWAAGHFNDWLVEGESLGKSSTQTIGRVTWLPIVSQDESSLVHLGSVFVIPMRSKVCTTAADPRPATCRVLSTPSYSTPNHQQSITGNSAGSGARCG